jgi:hypothetical protein
MAVVVTAAGVTVTKYSLRERPASRRSLQHGQAEMESSLILAETKHDLLASSVSLGVALLHAPSARYPSPSRRCLAHQYLHPFSALARLLPLLRAVFWCSEVPDVLSYPDDTARPVPQG